MTETTAIAAPGGPDDEPIKTIEPFAGTTRAAAIKTFAEALESRFDHSETGALAIARAVEDPSQARRGLGHLGSTRVEGGTLYTLDTRINAFSVVPYPTNLRVTGSTVYPAAVLNAGGGTAKFWSPRDVRVHPDSAVELALEAVTRARMIEALDLGEDVLRAQNDWSESIARTAVFLPITAIAMTINTTGSGEEPVTALVSPDGSSRVASCHRLLDIGPSDPLYGQISDPRNARRVIAELAATFERPSDQVTDTERVRARAVMIPARIIIGFTPSGSSGFSLLDAIEEYVAQIHIEPPKAWLDISVVNSKGDDVIRELLDAGEISESAAAYLGGMLSSSEATASKYPPRADERAARIVSVMSSPTTTKRGQAVRRGVLRHTVKVKAMSADKAEVAAGLALRAFSSANPGPRRSAEATLPRAFALRQIWDDRWQATARSPVALRDAALDELDKGRAGAAAIELTVRGAYVLATTEALKRESAGEMRDDNRSPQTILARLMSTKHGIHVLYRAIEDVHGGVPPRAVDENGEIALNLNGLPIPMTNKWIRTEFPDRVPGAASSAGSSSAASGGGTATAAPPPSPRELLRKKVRDAEGHVTTLVQTMADLRNITDDTGIPIVDTVGIDAPLAHQMAGELNKVQVTPMMHGATWSRENPQPMAGSEDVPDDDVPDDAEAEA